MLALIGTSSKFLSKYVAVMHLWSAGEISLMYMDVDTDIIHFIGTCSYNKILHYLF